MKGQENSFNETNLYMLAVKRLVLGDARQGFRSQGAAGGAIIHTSLEIPCSRAPRPFCIESLKALENNVRTC
jgi:hypothetical protein